MTTLNPNTPFYQDMTKMINVNSNPMPVGYWNLILSIRDCGLYAAGIKPNRHWKISDVKKYFGLKGNAKQLKTQLEEIRNQRWYFKP